MEVTLIPGGELHDLLRTDEGQASEGEYRCCSIADVLIEIELLKKQQPSLELQRLKDGRTAFHKEVNGGELYVAPLDDRVLLKGMFPDGEGRPSAEIWTVGSEHTDTRLWIRVISLRALDLDWGTQLAEQALDSAGA